jgi:hypothetical protein
MRTPTVSGMWMLVLSCWLYFVANARGQEMKAGCDELAGISPVAGVIRDRPFSARSYIRTFAVQSDGTRRFIRNERYPIRVARNSAGCVRVDFVDEPEEACAQLDVLVGPRPARSSSFVSPTMPTL